MTAAVYFAICALAVAAGLGLGVAGTAASLLLVGFLAWELPRIPPVQRAVGGALIGAGVLACWQTAAPLESVLLGLRQALPFLVLFAAVLCLQVPAQASPSLHAIGAVIVRQPPGRRYAAVAVGGHLLGAMLNLAGLQFVASVIERAGDARLRERLALAMMRGFSAGACWSPLFVSTAVVLSVVPGLGWTDIGPWGMAIAALLLFLAWASDRLRREAPPGATAAGPRLDAGAALRVAAVFLCLVGPVLALVESLGIGIAIALGLVAPPFAAAWAALIAGRRAPAAAAVAAIAGHARRRLPELRTEALIFTGASLLGTGLGALLRGQPLPDLPLSGGGLAGALVVAITLLGMVGVHPVVSVLVLGRALSPEAAGLSPTMLGVAMMAGWALGTMVSPFSATGMYVARLLGRPVWVVAWRWNAGYGLGAAAAVAAVLTVADAAF